MRTEKLQGVPYESVIRTQQLIAKLEDKISKLEASISETHKSDDRIAVKDIPDKLVEAYKSSYIQVILDSMKTAKLSSGGYLTDISQTYSLRRYTPVKNLAKDMATDAQAFRQAQQIIKANAGVIINANELPPMSLSKFIEDYGKSVYSDEFKKVSPMYTRYKVEYPD